MIHLPHEHTREFRDVLREFCRAEVLPGVAERDAHATYPVELVDRLAELGVLGITVAEEHGGLGLDMVTQVMAIEEVSYADASLGSVLAGHYLGMESIRAFGTEAQQARYLPGVADGSHRFAFGLTEPDAGSDIGAIRTTAVRDGDRWLLSGRKTFISSARESQGIIFFAKTDTDAGIRGLTAFIVDSEGSGLSYSAPIGKLGLRGEHAYEIALDGVVVDDDAILGEIGGGSLIALETLNSARIDVAAIASGVGLRALDLAVRHASERVQFGAPIRELQAVQAMLADIDAWVQSGRLHAYNAAAARDRGEDVRRLGSIGKYVATENCFQAVDAALQIHGGYGLTTESEIERLYRDCRVLRIYEGTSQIQQVTIARLLARRFDAVGTVRD
ncbi:MAG: acyl-CoA dehydrogenase family protein [Thermoleophilia bacterium]|nr:acyl-CoA dehydrogenase family protein [Thermoleophilia bacterium]